MTLSFLLSVPHAGLEVPRDLRGACLLTPEEIAADGDEGAREAYALGGEVRAFVTTELARAVLDMNRAEDDRRRDGVVKTHTCWDVPVWSSFPTEAEVESLLARHHRPYHRRLTELARGGAALGIDCHTMAAVGPPVGPDPGRERPAVCLSNADGTCPREWIEIAAELFRAALGLEVRINDPFNGGYITRRHATELPWLQLELSRAPFASWSEKRELVLAVLTRFAAELSART